VLQALPCAAQRTVWLRKYLQLTFSIYELSVLCCMLKVFDAH
jgi:hypothetical protein